MTSPPEQLIVPYKGVKFDASGQNVLVRPIPMQVQKGRYCTIYPFELASCQVLFPTPPGLRRRNCDFHSRAD